MPRPRPILEDAHRREFETPPLFDHSQRKYFFRVSEEVKPLLAQFDSPTNQLGFLLQLGYFRATRRFFALKVFRRQDADFVTKHLRLPAQEVNLMTYADTTVRRHRTLILQLLRIMPFQGAVRERCQQEAHQLVAQQLRLPLVFGSLCDFLRTHRMEIPAYTVFAEVIGQALADVEERLVQTLAEHLTPDQRKALDGLLTQLPDDEHPPWATSPMQLTRLRTTQELSHVKAIRENVVQLRQLKALYHQCRPVLDALALSDSAIEDFALQVMRSRSWQVKRWGNRELYLLAFVQYQYFYLSDTLTKTFLSAVELNVNQCEKQYKADRQQKYEQNVAQLADILHRYLEQGELLDQMQGLSYDFSQQMEDKFKGLLTALRSEPTMSFLKLMPMVRELYRQTTRHLKDEDYYEYIAKGSQKMQARVADLIRHLEFVTDDIDGPLAKAIGFFQQKDGQLTANAPTDFLKPQELANIFDADKKLRVSLYKSLLARRMMKGLKVGSLFVNTSHSYKSIDNYLIDELTWQQQKQTLLERASMRQFEAWETVKADIAAQLTRQFEHTFGRINNGENLWVKKHKDGTLRFTTPTLPDEESGAPIDLYPQERYTPLFEVLDTVNRSCHFLNAFQAARPEYQREKPADKVFLAGIIGMGCNLTTQRMAKTTKHISVSTLETTVRNYFNSANLQAANDQVSALMEKMNLATLYHKNPHGTHTSSDGQKFTVGLDSIHSTYSSKYFGKEKGVTIYSFINENHDLFSSTVFSATDCEAWYVVDGLVHNDVVRSQIHSTDTHGSTDPVFTVSYLISVDFQPRFSELFRQKLHGMEGMSIAQQADFKINAGDNINTEVVAQQWDRVLRLVTSIKLKHTMASRIMKRLNSYSLQNPLYQALKEVGKVLRTIFVLRFMDDELMRQRIHQQLEKMESANALFKAICYGNNGVLQYANHEDLLTMQGCKRLMENSVICWNYLYLTRLLMKASPVERRIIREMLPQTSPVAWQHFNFQGEFNFEDNAERDKLEELLEELLSYEPGPI